MRSRKWGREKREKDEKIEKVKKRQHNFFQSLRNIYASIKFSYELAISACNSNYSSSHFVLFLSSSRMDPKKIENFRKKIVERKCKWIVRFKKPLTNINKYISDRN